MPIINKKIPILFMLLCWYTFSQETITEGVVKYKHKTYEIIQNTRVLRDSSFSKTYFKDGLSRKAYYDHRLKANMIYVYDHKNRKGLSLMELSGGKKYYLKIDHSNLSNTTDKNQTHENKQDINYTKKQESKSILGYQCIHYSDKVEDVVFEEGYISEFIGPTVGLKESDFNGIRGLRLYWERKSLNYRNGKLRISKGIYNREKLSIVEAIEIKKQKLEDSLFSLMPPKDYKKIPKDGMITN